MLRVLRVRLGLLKGVLVLLGVRRVMLGRMRERLFVLLRLFRLYRMRKRMHEKLFIVRFFLFGMLRILHREL